MSESVPTSTPDPAPAAAPSVLEGLSAEERSHWRLTGEIKGASPSAVDPASHPSLSDVTPVSSPATPDNDQAAEIAASPSPASEPGTPKKSNAETRIKELLAKNAELLAQLDASKRRSESYAPSPTAPRDVTVESSPTPQPVTLATVVQSPDVSRPMLGEEEFFQQFPDATLGQHGLYQIRYELARVKATETQQARETARIASYQSAAKDVIANVPDTLLATIPQLINAKPVELLAPNETPTVWNYAAHEVLESKHAVALTKHLAEHPDEMAQLAATTSPLETVRMIARLEARIAGSSVSPPAPAGSPVSLAPPPPETLGKRPAQPADELSDAIRTGDFQRYRELQNRKDLKRA